jgi:hypothetical protein
MSMMILAWEGRDLTVFRSAKAAERYLEWQDVEAGVHQVFDEHGAHWATMVVEERRESRLPWRRLQREVRLVPAAVTEESTAELHSLLEGALAGAEGAESAISEGESLDALVARAAKRFGVIE